jgi:hypothetical protein
MVSSWALGKPIDVEQLKSKISRHCPFKYPSSIRCSPQTCGECAVVGEADDEGDGEGEQDEDAGAHQHQPRNYQQVPFGGKGTIV